MKKTTMIGFISFLLLCTGFYYVFRGQMKYINHVNIDYGAVSLSPFSKKSFLLFFCGIQKDDSETVFLFSETPAKDCFNLVSQWLLRAWQKRIISSPITCQSVIIDPLGTTVFVSFDFPLFNPALPVHSKILLINSLLKTIQQASSSFQSAYLFVRHEPIVDKHVDWIRPFETAGYSFTSF